MKNTQITLNRIAVITGLALGAFALSAAADWTAPANPPPTCPSGSAGCDAPINVGSILQTKAGSLQINGSLGIVGNLILGSGSPAFGKVLISNDSNGTAIWVATSSLGFGGSGGSGGVSQIVAGTNVTISPTSGVGNVTVNATIPTASGTVGGGCYAAWYGAGYTWTAWGNASYSSTCTCPTGYTARIIAYDTTTQGNVSAFLCLKN